MTHVISLASARAANPVHTSAQTPTFKPVPARRAPVLDAPALERQQAIENALSMALYFIRLPSTESGLKAATGRAIRAVSMLKQACAESTSGRA